MQASGHYVMTGNSFCALNYYIQKMLEDDISVAPEIRHMKKFKGNVRKKKVFNSKDYSLSSFTFASTYIYINIDITLA